MNIAQLNALLKDVALGRKSVHEYGEGDVYQNLNSGEHKYAYVNLTINSVQVTENTLIINCYLFYIDRLLEDSSNKLDIWTTGCNTLQQVLYAAKNGSEFFDFSNTTFTNFTEKFSDLCAGVYCSCDITILGNVSTCDEEYVYHESAWEKGFNDGWSSGYTDGVHSVPLTSITITENGRYTAEHGGYNDIEVNVSGGTIVSGSTTITENGEYDVAEYETAIVEIPTQDYFESGYTSGHSAGLIEGFQDGYSSGRTDGESEGWSEGWSSGETYGKEIGYASGYSAGEASVPLSSTAFTYNGVFTASTGGWSAVTIDVPQTGITPTGSITLSANGEYDVVLKAKAIVDVPVQDYYQSGYTSGWTDAMATSGETYNQGYMSGWTDGVASVPVQDYYNSGYTSGRTDGLVEGWTAGYESGSTDGYNSGLTIGYNSGVTHGEEVGYQSGWTGGYQSGYTDGAASIDTQAYFDSGYTSGYSAGEASVELTSTAFTLNGNYTKQNGGWSAVTVNIDTQAYFNSGYTSGYSIGFEDGYVSGQSITYGSPLVFMPTTNATVSMSTYGTAHPNLEYSLDEENWNVWDYSTINLSAGEYLFMRGVNSGMSSSVVDVAKFNTTGTIYVGGNIMSLLDGCAASTSTTIPTDFCFYGLFSGTTIDIAGTGSIPFKMPATALTESCYEGLFSCCTNLTIAPKLPALQMADFAYYSMFEGCTSLTTAPELPATTLAEGCYMNMLMGCTSLVGQISLPAETLTESCYQSLFAGCTSLCSTATTIHFYAKNISASSCTTNWLKDTGGTVLPKGKVYNYNNASLTRGSVSGIPTSFAEFRMQPYSPS